MKIQICGFSGSGKSTFARELSEKYNIKVLHLDSVHFTSGWVERANEDMDKDVREFIKNKDWIIDGNYSKIALNRFEECDKIFYFNFNRIVCLINAIKRYQKYKNKVRVDMAEGCPEKLDLEFIKWILYKGRKKAQRERLTRYKNEYGNKLIIFNNQKDVKRYLEALNA
ncbi:MAG: AAA family ATPase [Bacilli bacterium]|nr:AAA family ATPase [Bacilli bacterium]